jgi:DGQHR domain-containing protein
MTAIERPALVEVQRGQIMVSTTLTPSQLEALTKVDLYEPDLGNNPENGYQRRASTTRIAQAAAFYGEGIEKRQEREFKDRRGLMPNPIIANIRPVAEIRSRRLPPNGNEFAPGVQISFPTEADRARVEHALKSRSSTTANATILLVDGAVAWLVDGQHRAGAIELLRDRDRLGDDFPVPMKVMLGFSRDEEMRQFYYINSQAKNVPTDLTAELLQRMARQDSDEADYLSERKNKGRLLAGAAIFESMIAAGSPWIRRIRRPNEQASKDTSIAVSQFITSLGPLQSAPMPRQLTPEDWAKIIDAFWEAIARLLPQPFDPTEQPGDWVLFKATGVNTMHRVLVDCLPIIVQRGGRLADPIQYEQLLADLPSLSGVAIDSVTGDERLVNGAEFWRSASIASQYTGRYGTDRLVGMIRGLIAKTSGAVSV